MYLQNVVQSQFVEFSAKIKTRVKTPDFLELSERQASSCWELHSPEKLKRMLPSVGEDHVRAGDRVQQRQAGQLAGAGGPRRQGQGTVCPRSMV